MTLLTILIIAILAIVLVSTFVFNKQNAVKYIQRMIHMLFEKKEYSGATEVAKRIHLEVVQLKDSGELIDYLNADYPLRKNMSLTVGTDSSCNIMLPTDHGYIAPKQAVISVDDKGVFIQNVKSDKNLNGLKLIDSSGALNEMEQIEVEKEAKFIVGLCRIYIRDNYWFKANKKKPISIIAGSTDQSDSGSGDTISVPSKITSNNSNNDYDDDYVKLRMELYSDVPFPPSIRRKR